VEILTKPKFENIFLCYSEYFKYSPVCRFTFLYTILLNLFCFNFFNVRFEVESAPAIVFLKGPGVKPVVHHGTLLPAVLPEIQLNTLWSSFN
jgi:hypothetical protein